MGMKVTTQTTKNDGVEAGLRDARYRVILTSLVHISSRVPAIWLPWPRLLASWLLARLDLTNGAIPYLVLSRNNRVRGRIG